MSSLDLDFVITAPFRTLFNLNTDATAAAAGRAARLFADIARRLADRHGGEAFTAWRDPADQFAQYVTLSDDSVPASALPAIVARYPAEQAAALAPDAAAEIQNLSEIVASGPRVSLSDLQIHLFDNTLSLIRYVVKVRGLHVSDAKPFLDAFDPAAYRASVAVARHAHVVVADAAEAAAALEAGPHAPERGGAPIVRQPGGFLAFADVNFPHRDDVDVANDRRWPEDVDSVLWAARTLCLPLPHQDLAEEIATHWRVTAETRGAIPGAPDRWMACNIGSSVYLGTSEEFEAAGLAAALDKIQYFYALCDVIRRMFRDRYADLVDDITERRFTAVDAMVTRLNSQVSFAVSEYEEVALGLQLGRKWLFERFVAVYEMHRVIETMRMKQEAVTELVRDLRERFRKRSQRRIETAAFAIGGVTLVDFVLNLAAFSRDEVQPDAFWPPVDGGLSRALAHLSSDALAVLLIAALAGLVILYARSRQ